MKFNRNFVKNISRVILSVVLFAGLTACSHMDKNPGVYKFTVYDQAGNTLRTQLFGVGGIAAGDSWINSLCVLHPGSKVIVTRPTDGLVVQEQKCLGKAPSNKISEFTGFSEGYKLPLDLESTPKKYLMVNSLKGFKALSKEMKDFFDNRTTSLEYIPEGETFENWSKIIMPSIVTAKVSASEFTKTVIAVGAPKAKKHMILKEEIENKAGLQFSKLSIQDMDHKGQIELKYMEYYSSSSACSGILYVKKLKSWLSKKDAQKELKRMEQELSKYATVISS